MHAGRVREDEFAYPTTMYGCNKLYCEQLGRYYARHYKQLSADAIPHVDFRCVRFPGLMSGTTVPSGGTSDYAPEMIHAAASGEPYACFVRPDTTIPFMVMPDAIDALAGARRRAARADSREPRTTSRRSRRRRPTSGRSWRRAFPAAAISYRVDEKRQGIVDSWPAAVDDSAARADWGFSPRFDFSRAFSDYLVPTIRERYRKSPT